MIKNIIIQFIEILLNNWFIKLKVILFLNNLFDPKSLIKSFEFENQKVEQIWILKILNKYFEVLN